MQKKYPTIAVNIVTWNGRMYLEHALESLQQQTFTDFSILIIDNGSNDGTLSWLKEHYPHMRVVDNRRNLGFAKAHNQAIRFTASEYVLVMNQDVVLTETYLKKLIDVMEADTTLGSITGTLLRLAGSPHALSKESFSNRIDTTGISVSRTRRFTDRGAGAMFSNKEQFGNIVKGGDKINKEIFGVSGSLALYRRGALEDIKLGKEYFDEDFNSYKEDIDIAWRLQLRGWRALYVPYAIAYHHRTASGKEQQGNSATVANRRTKSYRVNLLSARNHLWLLIKNEHRGNMLRHLIFIVWYETKKWGYIVLFELKTLKALLQFFKGLPKMLQKRKIIQERARVSAEEMRKWFNKPGH